MSAFNPRVANLSSHTHYANRGGLHQGYLEFQDTCGQNSNSYTYIFEVELFNGVVSDVTGSRVVPEIDMAATKAQ